MWGSGSRRGPGGSGGRRGRSIWSMNSRRGGGGGDPQPSGGSGRAAAVAVDPLKEEEMLLETMEELKKTAAQLSKDVREKDEEVRKLQKQVDKLKNGKDRKKVDSDKMEGGDDAQSILGRKTAAEILPEEVWLKIFGYLSTPQDLWNLTNTCQLFETTLRPWKTGWMLEQALPHLYRHLPGNKLLECRLVSKGWKGALDGFFEEHPSLQPHSDRRDPRDLDFVFPMKEKRIGMRNCLTFNCDSSFTPRKKNFPRNPGQIPFLGRYVTLDLGREDDEPDFEDEDDYYAKQKEWYRNLHSFLREFGDHIWYLHLILPYATSTDEPINAKIVKFITRNMFQLLPNLRKLSMGGTDMYDQAINSRSIAAAPKLATICDDLLKYDDVLEPVLRRFHGQLRKIKLKDEFWRPVSNLAWGQLRELHVNFRLMNDNSFMRAFKHGGRKMPQLSKLILTLHVFQTKSKPTYDTLLEIINGLAATTRLSTLRLEGDIDKLVFPKSGMNFDPARSAKASRLKNLEIRESIPSFDFLLRCFPFVENLNVAIGKGKETANYSPEMDLLPRDDLKSYIEDRDELHGDHDEGKKEEIIEVKKHALDGQMYKSNIWEMLPLLKVFTFQWDVYSREGFGAYSRRQQSNMDAT